MSMALALLFLQSYIQHRTLQLSDVPGRNATDDATIELILHSYLLSPSTKPYNLSRPHVIDPSQGQTRVIDAVLKKKRGGFFIECGGLDGETRSNSLFLERRRGWTGLIIEADPLNFALVSSKNRKAYTSPSCLSTSPFMKEEIFVQDFNLGHIWDGSADAFLPFGDQTLTRIQCFPLASYLAALNVSTVDYFSLDVEGNELKVLKTIPWDEVNIKTLSVEYFHTPEGKDAVRDFVVSKGYQVYAEVLFDFIFVKNDLLIN